MSKKVGKLVSPMDEVDDEDEKNDAIMDLDQADDDSDSSENSDEDDNVGDIDATERRVMELKHSLSGNPYVYENHVELIKCLQKLGELDQLRSARKHMHELYPLTEELWLSWLRDEMKYTDDKNDVLSLFEDAVKDYLSVNIWMEYGQYAIGSLLSDSPDRVRAVLDQAISACGNHVIAGSQVWELSREFELAMLQVEQAKTGIDAEKAVNLQKSRINDVFKAQLAVPLFELEKTYAEYCAWLDGVEPDKVTVAAYDRALKMYADRKPFEDVLLETDPPAVEAYTSYLNFEEQQGDVTRVSCLYERAVNDHPLVEEFWRHYVAFLERKLKSGTVICTVYERAVRNVPWSAELWIKWAQALERCNGAIHEKIQKIYEDALQAGFQKESDQVQVWVAYLDYLRRRINWSVAHSEELALLRSVFQRAEETVNSMQERREHLPTVLKYWAWIEAKFCQNLAKARHYWHMVTRLGRGNQADLWLEYIAFERAFGDSPSDCISICQSALNAVVDRPEAICAAYINFAREACTLEQIDEAISACEKRNALLKKRTAVQSERENAKAERNAAKNLPSGSAKHSGLGFHKEKGKPENNRQDRAPKFVKSGDGGQQRQSENKRRIEQQEQPVEGESPFKKPFAPPSKKETSTFKEPTVPPAFVKPDAPLPRREQPNLSEEHGTTIFLSNLDFTVTEDEIRQFFKDCGTIDELRLVMKSQKLNRGFAYVKFANEKLAEAALALDRHKIKNRPAFVSRYQDKSAEDASGAEKKSGLIYAASLEKNKLFVKNVPLSCTEDQLKTAFSAHGTVTAARLVTFKDGNPKGIAYVEFDSAENAEKARLAVNGTALLGEGKILSVEISNPPPKKAVGDFAASTSSSARKGAVAAFYSNLGVGSRHHTSGSGQQTRIAVPEKPADNDSQNGNGSSAEGQKMSNAEFRKFLSK